MINELPVKCAQLAGAVNRSRPVQVLAGRTDVYSIHGVHVQSCLVGVLLVRVPATLSTARMVDFTVYRYVGISALKSKT